MSSSIAVSWAWGESSLRGEGCNVSGRREASGGIEIRAARGAVVDGISEAWGFHGAVDNLNISMSLDVALVALLSRTYGEPLSPSVGQALSLQLDCLFDDSPMLEMAGYPLQIH